MKKAKRDLVWSGPSLATVLAACGMPFSQDTERDILRHYIVATGSDGYMIVSSTAEAIEQFSGISTIVAIKRDGQPLGAIGQFALFNNQDKMPARHVSNLDTLDVRLATQQNVAVAEEISLDDQRKIREAIEAGVFGPRAAADLDWENVFGVRFCHAKDLQRFVTNGIAPLSTDKTVNDTLETRIHLVSPTVAVADVYSKLSGQLDSNTMQTAADDGFATPMC